MRVARVLTETGYPDPARQLAAATSLGTLHVDLGYEGPPVVAFEYDSDQFHSTRTRRHRDVERRNALRVAGVVVLEVTPSLVRERTRLLALVDEALGRRAS